MKNAAKCEKQCELQNLASHRIFERKWRWVLPSMFVSVCKVFIKLNAVELNCISNSFLPLNKVGRPSEVIPNDVVTVTHSELVWGSLIKCYK